jgi:uncharacterized protein
MEQPRKRSPLAFFGLVFLFSLPFWAAGELTSRQLLPALPVSAFGVLCPLLAAVILANREQGRPGVSALLKRSFEIQQIQKKAWLAPVLLLDPLIKTLAYFVMRVSGTAVPAPVFSAGQVLSLLVLFIVAGLCEELGWTGYVTDPLQARFGALPASLLIGAVWGIWHFLPLLQAQRSVEFIAWWFLATVSARVIIVWLYNNTGRSVFTAALYHAIMNLTWQLFPINGSFYDPRVIGPITAVAALIMVVIWGPRKLSQQA